MLLYGWCFKFMFWTAGRLLNSGQIESLGEPSRSMIKLNWWISDLPGKSGLCAKSSPKMQPEGNRKASQSKNYSTRRCSNLPAAHISNAVVCVLALRSSSGDLYHKVTTPGVMGRKGRPYFLANPKSAKSNSKCYAKNHFSMIQLNDSTYQFWGFLCPSSVSLKLWDLYAQWNSCAGALVLWTSGLGYT